VVVTVRRAPKMNALMKIKMVMLLDELALIAKWKRTSNTDPNHVSTLYTRLYIS